MSDRIKLLSSLSFQSSFSTSEIIQWFVRYINIKQKKIFSISVYVVVFICLHSFPHERRKSRNKKKIAFHIVQTHRHKTNQIWWKVNGFRVYHKIFDWCLCNKFLCLLASDDWVKKKKEKKTKKTDEYIYFYSRTHFFFFLLTYLFIMH